MAVKFEEYKEIKYYWSWILLALFCAVLIGWAVFVHLMVPEAKRTWNYSTVPDPPAVSEFSTHEPTQNQNPPEQIQILPEAEDTTSAEENNNQ